MKKLTRSQRYFVNNREQILQRRRSFYKENPLAQTVRSAKQRAKQKNIPFSITWKDLSIPKICPVLGIPIIISSGSSNWNSPSVDRIIPELGYTKDNVRIISLRANILKNNMTLEEAELILNDIKTIRHNHRATHSL